MSMSMSTRCPNALPVLHNSYTVTRVMEKPSRVMGATDDSETGKNCTHLRSAGILSMFIEVQRDKFGRLYR